VLDHPLALLLGFGAALATAGIAAIAIRVRLLPEVIDVSIILTFSGLGALAFAFYGALRGYDPDRLGRLTLGGTLAGGLVGVLVLVVFLLQAVLS